MLTNGHKKCDGTIFSVVHLLITSNSGLPINQKKFKNLDDLKAFTYYCF